MYGHTDTRLIPLAKTHSILYDFMTNCPVSMQNDGHKGIFKLFVPYSPWLWRPVTRHLDLECHAILPEAFKKFGDSNLMKSHVEFHREEQYSYTVEWQMDAYRRGVFDTIENLPTKSLDKETGRIRV